MLFHQNYTEVAAGLNCYPTISHQFLSFLMTNLWVMSGQAIFRERDILQSLNVRRIQFEAIISTYGHFTLNMLSVLKGRNQPGPDFETRCSMLLCKPVWSWRHARLTPPFP